jgi:protease-4
MRHARGATIVVVKKFILGFVIGLVFAALVGVILIFAAARLGERKPDVATGSTLVLHLEGDLPEQASLDVPIPYLQDQPPMTIAETWEVLRKAAVDSRVKALIVEPRGLAVGWAKLEELRSDIVAFKKSGKPVYAYLRGPAAHEYYLATAADKIYMAPEDLLDVKGLKAELMYVKGTLDKLGVEMEFEHVGKYKDYPDTFTKDGPSPETLEVTNQILDQYYGNLVNVIAEGRKKQPDAIRALLDQGPFLGKPAVDAGLLDGLAFPDELPVKENLITDRAYQRADVPGFEGKTKIALLVGDGDITRGSGENSLSDNGITSGGMIKRIKEVENDQSIKGVILRIDSPGGDGIASDDILHEAQALSKKKPVVISMSDTAASGGYFIAMTGDPIVAYSNTLTGSIGVFYGRVNLLGLYDKIGLKKDILSRGRYARIDTDYGPLSPDERGKLKSEIEVFYNSFVAKVANGRKRQFDQIEPLAQGRVWLGTQAKQNGLVDEIGGLDRALDMVKERAKIPASERVALVPYPPRKTLVEYLLNRDDDTPSVETALINRKIRALVGNVPIQALAHGGIMRLMPFAIEVK